MPGLAYNVSPARKGMKTAIRGLEAPAVRRHGSTCELTILMPCLNEAETIGTCVEKATGFLRRRRIDGEVLVADNGSVDDSRAIAERRGARVINAPGFSESPNNRAGSTGPGIVSRPDGKRAKPTFA